MACIKNWLVDLGFSHRVKRGRQLKTFHRYKCTRCGRVREFQPSQVATNERRCKYVSCGCWRIDNLAQHNRRRRRDRTGETHGYLTVLHEVERPTGGGARRWACHCNRCGNDCVVSNGDLPGRSSCGCLFGEDYSGRQFDYFLVVGPSDRQHSKPGRHWRCQCLIPECGKFFYLTTGDVRQGINHGISRTCGDHMDFFGARRTIRNINKVMELSNEKAIQQ